MLSEQAIQQALHAGRVVPLSVANPHGPLGLENLAAAVVAMVNSSSPPGQERIRRPIDLPLETWEKLDHLAQSATQNTSGRVTPSEVAAAIIEQFLVTK